jgi:hypothetical protein
MSRPKGLPADFEGPAYDAEHGYTPETGMALRDGARRSSPDKSRYLAVAEQTKFCLRPSCGHWARLHPGHGPCQGFIIGGDIRPCGCEEFADPEPGRPDQVYTRDQVDRMLRWRWERVKDRVYLMKDGRYGLLDPWTDKNKYFA